MSSLVHNFYDPVLCPGLTCYHLIVIFLDVQNNFFLLSCNTIRLVGFVFAFSYGLLMKRSGSLGE